MASRRPRREAGGYDVIHNFNPHVIEFWYTRTQQWLSLAKPDPKREARGSGDKPILRFVLPAEILQSNQIAERLIKIPIPREPARRYGFGLRVQVSFDTAQNERQPEVQQGN